MDFRNFWIRLNTPSGAHLSASNSTHSRPFSLLPCGTGVPPSLAAGPHPALPMSCRGGFRHHQPSPTPYYRWREWGRPVEAPERFLLTSAIANPSPLPPRHSTTSPLWPSIKSRARRLPGVRRPHLPLETSLACWISIFPAAMNSATDSLAFDSPPPMNLLSNLFVLKELHVVAHSSNPFPLFLDG
jgi:hypothetical protein